MALPRPPELLRWGTDETNDTEPLEAKKDTGYLVNEEPSSAEINWLLRIAGEMQEWWRERAFDGLIGGGGDSEDLLIRSPVPATGGGTLSIKSADAVGSGDGGPLAVEAGDGFGTGDGGSLTLSGGGAGATGLGGVVAIQSGNTLDNNGATALITGGGGFGTDRNGGDLLLRAGRASGNGSSSVLMQAVDGGQGTGAEARLSTPYLEADGVNQRVLLNRRIEILNSDTSRGVANFQDQSGVDPAAATDGELYIRSDGHLPRLFDGSVWDRFHMQKHVLTVPTSLSTVGNFPGLIIPGNALTLGSVVKIRGSMEMVGDAGGGGITAQVRIGGIVVAAGGIFGTASIGDFLMWDISVVFRTVGVTGLWKTCGYEADSVESPTLLLQNTDYADTGTINTTGDIVVEQRVNVISAGDVWSQGFFTVDFT